MRAALTEAVIAQELSESIFKEYYNLNQFTGIGNDIVVNTIAALAKTHPLHAAIVRAQLTKACNSSSDVAKIPARAAESVSTILGGWIGEENQPQRQQLLEELEVLFSDAMRLWQPLQRALQRIATRMDLSAEYWDEEEDKRNAYDDENDDAPSGEGGMTSTISGPMAILFPQVLADGKYLLYGNALFHTQYAVLAAARENARSQQDRQGASVPRLRRKSKNEARPGRRLSSASTSTMHHKKPPSTPSELSYTETHASNLARGVADSTISKLSATG